MVIVSMTQHNQVVTNYLHCDFLLMNAPKHITEGTVLWILLYHINSFYHRNYEFLFFTAELYRIQFKPLTLTRELKPYTKIKNTSMPLMTFSRLRKLI
jgi:hypothetical protein